MSKWDRARRALLKIKDLGEGRARLAMTAAAARGGDATAAAPREPAAGDVEALRAHLGRDAQAEELSVFEAAYRAVVDQASPPSGPTHCRVVYEEPEPRRFVSVTIEQPDPLSWKPVHADIIRPDVDSGSTTDNEPAGQGKEDSK